MVWRGEDPQPKEVERSMRRLTLLAALVLAVVLIAAVPVVAAQRATLEASLTGEKEVPGPGDPNGRGNAEVKVYKAKVCYELKVRRIAPAEAAHIHLGLRGEADRKSTRLNSSHANIS